MGDMTAVIVPKSDQINADDMMSGPITITVKAVSVRPGTEQPVAIDFGDPSRKVFRPCKSMARVMVAAWGPDSSKYVGKSMTLYRDPKVKWGGLEVGGIRISHMSDITGPMTLALTETKQSRKPFTVKLLVAEKKVAPPKAEPEPTTEDAGATSDWADLFEDLIDTAATYAVVKTEINQLLTSPEWQRLKASNIDRATELHAKIAALKSAAAVTA